MQASPPAHVSGCKLQQVSPSLAPTAPFEMCQRPAVMRMQLRLTQPATACPHESDFAGSVGCPGYTAGCPAACGLHERGGRRGAEARQMSAKEAGAPDWPDCALLCEACSTESQGVHLHRLGGLPLPDAEQAAHAPNPRPQLAAPGWFCGIDRCGNARPPIDCACPSQSETRAHCHCHTFEDRQIFSFWRRCSQEGRPLVLVRAVHDGQYHVLQSASRCGGGKRGGGLGREQQGLHLVCSGQRQTALVQLRCATGAAGGRAAPRLCGWGSQHAQPHQK